MIKVYIPDHSLQGSEIPLYVLWDSSEIIDLIKIKYPEGTEILEIYNINNENDYNINNNILQISNTNVNGYLGVKFRSELVDPEYKGYFRVSLFKEGDEIYVYEKYVVLFRPEVAIIELPDHLIMKIDDNNKITIDNSIKIINEGKGTAILRVKSSDSSEINIFDPMGIDEFRKKFWNDAERKLVTLKEKYPTYSTLIVGFVDLGKNPPVFNKKDLKKLQKLYRELFTAFEENEDFLTDFANIILTSYLKNISIVTELESFLIYLRTIHENKIIFIDAISAIKVDTTPKTFSATMYVTDLAYNEYKPIEINMSIKANKEGIIPLYLLFDFVSLKHGGD